MQHVLLTIHDYMRDDELVRLCRALVATLAGMALANCGYLPPHCKELKMVFDYILPLAIPMLLYSADLR